MRQIRFTSLALVAAFALAATTGATPARADHVETAGALPDLGMLAPRDFSIERRPKGVRWLRFDTIVVNVGPGPFDVYGYQAADRPAGEYSVVQRFQRSDGTWAKHATLGATMFYDGDGHGHWHVREFQEWTIASTTEPARALRAGAKTGFCFWDNYDYTATGPVYYHPDPRYHHPDTTPACELDAATSTVPMGLSVGWGDEYPSTIAGQYIDITRLALGDYIVTLEADPHRQFFESTPENNTAWAHIRITKSGVRVIDSGTDLEPGA